MARADADAGSRVGTLILYAPSADSPARYTMSACMRSTFKTSMGSTTDVEQYVQPGLLCHQRLQSIESLLLPLLLQLSEFACEGEISL
jgi:hypothetical protein